MKIWEVKNLGLDNLSLSNKDMTPIKNNEVLVEMKAATLNYRDLIMIDGGYGTVEESLHLYLFQMVPE